MSFSIREVTAEDDPAIAALLTAVNPRQPVAAEQLQLGRAKTVNSLLGLHLAQWVAEIPGRAVGFLGITQWAGWFKPDRYMLQLAVHPDYARQGVGTRLAAVAEAHLRQRGARELFAWAYEDEPQAVNFLTRRGFLETAREFESVLNVQTFPWTDWQERLTLPAGYMHLTYPEFAQQYGQEHALEAYTAVFNEGRLAQPNTVHPRLYTTPEVQEYLGRPAFFPEGIHLAVTPLGQVAALSELWLDPNDPQRLRTGLTATSPEHRRRGLALGLKLAGIHAAQARGTLEIHTSNDSTNAGMLGINRALGFQPHPAHIEFKWGSV